MWKNICRKLVVDLRSDTVTKPSKEMLQYVINNCEFGDDVMNEDETVNLLEKKVAKLFNKESGLFCCSGTMSNQLACRVHLCEPLYHMISDEDCHINVFEVNGIAYHTGCSQKTIKPKGEFITMEEIEENIFVDEDVHCSTTKLISLENTFHGMVFPIEEIKRIHVLAKKYDLKMHLDGARIWNSSIQSGIGLEEYGKYFDTISACLSKGLGSPIGSVLVGDNDDIEKATKYRKMFGGGWRQAGVIAGCGIYAIDNNWDKMKIDHENAKYLEGELRNMGIDVIGNVETNMVFVSNKDLSYTWEEISNILNEKNIKIWLEGDDPQICRFVCHLQITKDDINYLLKELKNVLKLN